MPIAESPRVIVNLIEYRDARKAHVDPAARPAAFPQFTLAPRKPLSLRQIAHRQRMVAHLAVQ